VRLVAGDECVGPLPVGLQLPGRALDLVEAHADGGDDGGVVLVISAVALQGLDPALEPLQGRVELWAEAA